MEKSEPAVAICDAGPIIHLDELGALDLVEGFARILIPAAVLGEIARHRPRVGIMSITQGEAVPDTSSISPGLAALATAFSLDRGETMALAVMEVHPGATFLTDDSAARLAAESRGARVHGTLGLLVRSIRRGHRTHEQVVELLQALPSRSTLHVSQRLLATVIARVKQFRGG